MNESQDCPKIPREPIDKLTNSTWRYFDVCNNSNNNYTFFIQGNSVSYLMLTAIKSSPVTKKI